MFKQQPSKEKAKETPKFSSRMIPGVFMGYVQNPGGEGSGRYKVAALTQFIGMDFRTGKTKSKDPNSAIFCQKPARIEFDKENIVFPLRVL